MDAQRVAQDLARVPGDDARLHLIVAGAAPEDGRRELEDEGIRVDNGHGPVKEDDQGAVM